MSWQDRIKDIDFEITTGDGKVFKPLWQTAEKEFEFNVAKYDFINSPGSFVDRKKPQGTAFPITFFFQGADNIEQCNDFEASAVDERAWTIIHPFYGTIKGHPTKIKRDDSSFNITAITINFWESIDADFPTSAISASDAVAIKAEEVTNTSAALMVENAVPDTKDIPKLLQLLQTGAAKFKAGKDKFNDYNNKIKAAERSLDNIVADVGQAVNDIQAVINAPFEFATKISDKIRGYSQSFEVLNGTLGNLFSKYNYETQGASIFASMAQAAVNPQPGDYTTREDIEQVNQIILNLYDNYLAIADSAQVSVYDVDNAWGPNIQIQIALADLISFTSQALFQLSFNARQEIEVELTADSNLIILCHRYLGLDASDENIGVFKEINNIKNEELYKIRQGRLIKYFI